MANGVYSEGLETLPSLSATLNSVVREARQPNHQGFLETCSTLWLLVIGGC